MFLHEKKKKKIMTRSKWKSFYINLNILKKFKNLKNQKSIYIHSKNSSILKEFIGRTFYVYQGQKYQKVKITNNMVNYKFGEFVFTRRIGKIHKKT